MRPSCRGRTSGIIFSIIISRPPRGLLMMIERLEIETPVGGFNGGVIATPDLAMVTDHLLSRLRSPGVRAAGRSRHSSKLPAEFSSRYGRKEPWR